MIRTAFLLVAATLSGPWTGWIVLGVPIGELVATVYLTRKGDQDADSSRGA